MQMSALKASKREVGLKMTCPRIINIRSFIVQIIAVREFFTNRCLLYPFILTISKEEI